jgi:hypothetical protein
MALRVARMQIFERKTESQMTCPSSCAGESFSPGWERRNRKKTAKLPRRGRVVASGRRSLSKNGTAFLSAVSISSSIALAQSEEIHPNENLADLFGERGRNSGNSPDQSAKDVLREEGELAPVHARPVYQERSSRIAGFRSASPASWDASSPPRRSGSAPARSGSVEGMYNLAAGKAARYQVQFATSSPGPRRPARNRAHAALRGRS